MEARKDACSSSTERKRFVGTSRILSPDPLKAHSAERLGFWQPGLSACLIRILLRENPVELEGFFLSPHLDEKVTQRSLCPVNIYRLQPNGAA